MLNEISQLENELYADDEVTFNVSKAQRIVQLYNEFVLQFSSDKELAPEYLFKTADVCLGLQDHLQALRVLERIITNYPDFNKIVESYYLKAFVLDAHIGKKGEAQEAYRALINKFPEHKLADDASAAIKVLTMSDEDLIKMFEEKNK